MNEVPEYASPGSPPVITPVGRRRRLQGFPAAPELSAPLLERVPLQATAASGAATGRRLQEAETAQKSTSSKQQQDLTLSSTSQPVHAMPPRHRRLQQQEPSQQQQQQQQQQAGAPRPLRAGWHGLWWTDAGGVSVAAGPRHALHAVSGALTVYDVDPGSGAQTGARTVSLQDLFAPVGAANCRCVHTHVYDACSKAPH
jgi:hypothetical protein